MRRSLILLACLGWLNAVETNASEFAADLIATRATELANHGDTLLARQLEELANGLRTKRFSLDEAQHLLVILQNLPPLTHRSSPPPSVMSADQASAALDGLMPPPVVAPDPPASVPSAAVQTPPVLPRPAGPEPRVIGKVLAIEPGADGRPALLAWTTDAKAGVQVGQRIAVRRDHTTMALGRITAVKPDLTIALLIPGTWKDEKAEIRVDDEVTLVDER